MTQPNQLREIFEFELHRKLSLNAKTSNSEMLLLLNSFKYFDIENNGLIDKENWLKVFQKMGLTNFTDDDLRLLFEIYDVRQQGKIDYKNFCNYLYEIVSSLPQTQTQQQINYEEEKNQILNSANTTNTTINNNTNNLNNFPSYLPQKSQEVEIPPLEKMIVRTPLSNNNFNNVDNYNQNSLDNMKEFALKKENREMKNYFQTLTLGIQSKIITNDGITFYTLINSLINNCSDNNYNINFENFSKSFRDLNINIDIKILNDFFMVLDFNEKNLVNINEIINVLKGTISEERKNAIMNKFVGIDVEKKGNVNIEILKQIFNSKNHPDFINGKKNERDIYEEFLYMFEIYLKLKYINNNFISYEDFIEFYSIISPSYENDNQFREILNVWDGAYLLNLNNNNLNLNSNTTNTINNTNNLLTLNVNNDSSSLAKDLSDKISYTQKTIHKPRTTYSKDYQLYNLSDLSYTIDKNALQSSKQVHNSLEFGNRIPINSTYLSTYIKPTTTGDRYIPKSLQTSQQVFNALHSTQQPNEIDTSTYYNAYKKPDRYDIPKIDKNLLQSSNQVHDSLNANYNDPNVSTYNNFYTKPTGVERPDKPKSQLTSKNIAEALDEDLPFTNLSTTYVGAYTKPDKYDRFKIDKNALQSSNQIYNSLNLRNKPFDGLTTYNKYYYQRPISSDNKNIRNLQTSNQVHDSLNYGYNIDYDENEPYYNLKTVKYNFANPQQYKYRQNNENYLLNNTGSRTGQSQKVISTQFGVNNVQNLRYQNNSNNNINLNVTNNDPLAILSYIRSNLIQRGIKSIFILQRWFNLYDKNASGKITFENFDLILNNYKFDEIPSQSRQALFSLFDVNKNGLMEYDGFIKCLIGNVSDYKKAVIKKIYNTIPIDINGNIKIEDIKNNYNPIKHPDVLSGKKNFDMLKNEFNDMIDIYRQYNEYLNKRNFESLSLNEFIEFYAEFSLDVTDDKTFDDLIGKIWNLSANNNLSRAAVAGQQIIGGY
jgi:Ca2+-binding EF-hand superfamily protein